MSRGCIRVSIEKSSKQAAEKGPQLRSRFDKILNVPQRVRLRFSLTCGLAGCLFEQSAATTVPDRRDKRDGGLEP